MFIISFVLQEETLFQTDGTTNETQPRTRQLKDRNRSEQITTQCTSPPHEQPKERPKKTQKRKIENLLFSAFDVNEEKDNAHEQTDGAHRDVGDAQEGVLPAQQRRRGQDDALRPAKLRHAES
jgi:hypothetical protein